MYNYLTAPIWDSVLLEKTAKILNEFPPQQKKTKIQLETTCEVPNFKPLSAASHSNSKAEKSVPLNNIWMPY